MNSEPEITGKKDGVRLKDFVIPTNYNLNIYLDILNLKYEIKEQITLSFKQDNLTYFSLHALKDFQITKLQISTSYDNISEKYKFSNCLFLYSSDIVTIIKTARNKFYEIIDIIKLIKIKYVSYLHKKVLYRLHKA